MGNVIVMLPFIYTTFFVTIVKVPTDYVNTVEGLKETEQLCRMSGVRGFIIV